MAKPTPITIPTEPIGSIPRPVDLIEKIAKGDSEEIPTSPLSMKMPFETRLNGLKPQAHRLLRTANRGSITIATCIACTGFQTRSHCPSRPPFETPEEVRDHLFEPDKNWRWC
jgi:hypothetical protein